MTITIFREITLRQIVTGQSKDISLRQLHDQLTELMKEIDGFEEEKNKMLAGFALRGGDGSQAENLRKQLDGESQRFFRRKDEIMRRIGEVQELREGEEIAAGSLEGPWELKVGDDFTALGRAQIVLKDGVVAEIRTD
ncbi:MAG: YlqD family protein [Gracilibacteraceae bacterium]|jgi:hypothetical protein|nr:YlqD family protein [Gracilibacteraceae bacterium]